MMEFKNLFKSFTGRNQKKKPAVMELISWQKPGPYVDISYLIQWKYEDGSVRVPEEAAKAEYPYDDFVVAGKHYSRLDDLCAVNLGEDQLFRDVYGREVFAFRERFPCFDSYDYLYEHRYFRWFYIREGDSLYCVYYVDEQRTVKITDDVRRIEKRDAWESMRALNWQG